MIRTLGCLAMLGAACGTAENDPCAQGSAKARVKGLPNTGPEGVTFTLENVRGVFDDATARGSLTGDNGSVAFSLELTSRPAVAATARLRLITVSSESNGPAWSIRDPADPDYVLRVDSVCPGADDGQTQTFTIHGVVSATLKPEGGDASGDLEAVVTF